MIKAASILCQHWYSYENEKGYTSNYTNFNSLEECKEFFSKTNGITKVRVYKLFTEYDIKNVLVEKENN